jgi:UDP-2-acetamido-3-amino-2,3-dideoxy-glucuronate N-acetyltransferase
VADVKNDPYAALHYAANRYGGLDYAKPTYAEASYTPQGPVKENLIGRINLKDAVVGIVGHGDACLVSAIRFAKSGYRTMVVDADAEKGARTRREEAAVEGVDASELNGLLAKKKLMVVEGDDALLSADCLVAVISSTAPDPDRAVQALADRLGPILRPRHLVVVETDGPGAVDPARVATMLHLGSGLLLGTDIFVAVLTMSVDRKEIQGATEGCVAVAEALYRTVGLKIGASGVATAKTGRGAIVHPTAVVDPGARIGAGSRIWHFSHLMSGAVIGEGCVLGQNVFVGGRVTVGDRVKIQNNVSLYDGVILEDDVFVGPSAVFTNVSAPRAYVSRKDRFETTRVHKGATIGANATIISGNVIGAYAFVGAGAVVTREVAKHALVVGNPATRIGWVCRCGERLPESLICAACEARYRVDDGECEAITE